MNWRELINTILNDFRMSTYEIQDKTGVPHPVLHKLKTGQTKSPNQNTIKRLEEGLGIRIDDRDPGNITYQKLEDKQEPKNKFESAISVYVYPLLSTVYAGEPTMLYVEHTDESANFVYGKKDHRCFAVRVSGKSMETTLKDGDIVLVDMDLLPEDGDLVAVRLKNGHQYIKRYRNLNYSFIQLSSDNSDYGVRVIDKNDIEAIYPVVAINLFIRNGDRKNKINAV